MVTAARIRSQVKCANHSATPPQDAANTVGATSAAGAAGATGATGAAGVTGATGTTDAADAQRYKSSSGCSRCSRCRWYKRCSRGISCSRCSSCSKCSKYKTELSNHKLSNEQNHQEPHHFYCLSNFMPPFVLKTIYQAQISSVSNYCNIIRANTYPTHLQPLIRMQKRIIRIITSSDFLTHTEPLFLQTNISNIENLRKFSLIIHF